MKLITFILDTMVQLVKSLIFSLEYANLKPFYVLILALL